jgi:hypothetical protein
MRRSAVIIGVAFLAYACNGVATPREAVLLGIQDVVAPTEVAAGAELVATITLVTGGCKAFERFETRASSARLTVEAWGTDASNQSCPADVRYEPREFRASLPSGNPVVLAVRQPNGDELVRTIQVR